jgi:ribosomal protein S3
MKNKILNYLRFFAIRYLGFKIKVDNKKVRRSMNQYFYSNEWNYITTITKIETYETKKGLEIFIESHRVGILIGKKGSFIDGLKEWIKEDLERTDITFHLKECKLWSNLY